MSQHIGYAAEDKAKKYLQSQGLKCIASNYRCRCGEIDLIMQDGSCLVFIEVRARASNAFGGALASVTFKKQQKVIKSALSYLVRYNLGEKYPVRFDVVSIEGKSAAISWVKNAFEADF